MSSTSREISAGNRVLPKARPSSFRRECVAILWFRNDVRVRHNEALAFANDADFLPPTYVFDERQCGCAHLCPHGFQHTWSFRAKFLWPAMLDVRSLLKKVSSDMFIDFGRTEKYLVEPDFSVG